MTNKHITAYLNFGFTSFHSTAGLCFTFPSQYSSTITHLTYSALEGGSPLLERLEATLYQLQV